MEQLLMLKSLGNSELVDLVHMVERYQERRNCIIYTTIDDTGMYVYDTKNIELLLYIDVANRLITNTQEKTYNKVV